MEKLWRKNLINIEPYVAGEQSKSPDLIKLNANENAYPPSPKVYETIKSFDPGVLRRYPDMQAQPLKSELAKYYGVDESQLFIGNGSDDVLATAFRAFFNSEKPIFYPDITYSFYPVWCRLLKVPYKIIPVKSDFSIDVEDYSLDCGGVVLPNPNAPTSLFMGLDKIKRLLELNRDCIVILDETYIDFGGESALPLINQYDNLVITRTFSKSRSLAGMRIGFAFGSAELISYMNAVRDSYNSYPLDSVALAVGSASVKDEKYFRETLEKIIKTRENTKKSLEELGFKVLDSKTNFLFATHKEKSAVDIFEYLKARDIFVRHFSAPKINNYLRITIGTDKEMEIMLKNIKEFLEK